LIAPLLKIILVILEKVFVIVQKKDDPPLPYDKCTNTVNLPLEIEQELRRLISTGYRVEAVKRVTKLTGAGLRISKDYVDNLDL